MTSLLFFWTVLQHTPSWVWAVFALLVLLGLKQSRPSQVGPTRATLLPVAMLLLALAGVLGAFASAAALLAWAAATVAVATLRAEPAARGARWSPADGRFHLPGSWTPMALMMGIFATKFAVGVGLALHPELARSAGFALGISALYGVFSGSFAARALALHRLRGRAAQAQPA